MRRIQQPAACPVKIDRYLLTAVVAYILFTSCECWKASFDAGWLVYTYTAAARMRVVWACENERTHTYKTEKAGVCRNACLLAVYYYCSCMAFLSFHRPQGTRFGRKAHTYYAQKTSLGRAERTIGWCCSVGLTSRGETIACSLARIVGVLEHSDPSWEALMSFNDGETHESLWRLLPVFRDSNSSRSGSTAVVAAVVPCQNTHRYCRYAQQ